MPAFVLEGFGPRQSIPTEGFSGVVLPTVSADVTIPLGTSVDGEALTSAPTVTLSNLEVSGSVGITTVDVYVSPTELTGYISET